MPSVLIHITSLLAAEEVAAPAHGSGGIGAIGIDPKALAFQVINFAILLWILKRVAYKPILQALETRRRKIEQSLKQAKEIETATEQMAAHNEKMLAQTKARAEQILKAGRTEAAAMLKQAEEDSRARNDRMLAQTHNQIRDEMKKAKEQLKKETMSLVISATETILEEKLDTEKDAQLIKRALEKEVV